MTAEIARSGLTGWYYRVLGTGSCRAGDEIYVVGRDPAMMSVMELNRLFYGDRLDERLLAKFNLLTTPTQKWHEDMRRKLEGSYDDGFMRLWNLASKRRFRTAKQRRALLF